MENAGVIISGIKGIYYEWVRDVPTAVAIDKAVNSAPSDLTL
jgi:hypothetical protein